MDIILTDVIARLTSEVPELKYIDEDWGQLDDYSPNFPVKWPCALADCFAANWQNMGNKGQLGLANIVITYADIKLSNSSAKAPANQKANSLLFHTLKKKIYQALHGWTGHQHYTALIRTAERRIKRNDGVRAIELIFTVEIKDVSAAPVLAKAPKPKIIFDVAMRHQNPYLMGGIGNDVIEDGFTVQ